MIHESPVFIVGMPRSGTTLMRAFIAAHPGIAIAPETHFLSYWIRRHGGGELHDWPDYHHFWAEFTASHHFARLGLEAEAVDAWLATGEAPTFGAVFAALMSAYAEANGKPRWGEKTPGHHAHLDRLFRWYPHAQVIYMLRDPRAVIASLLQAPWADASITHQAGRWRDSARALAARERDERVHIVHYEALVTDPEATLQRTCAFLGESFDAAMLARGGASREEGGGYGGWGRGHMRRAHAPVRTDSLLKWQDQLTVQQVARVEYLTRKGMFRYGYAPVTEGPGAIGWARLMGARVCDRAFREFYRLRDGRSDTVASVPPGAATKTDAVVKSQATDDRREPS